MISRMKRVLTSIRGWIAALFLLRNPDDLDEVFKLDAALDRDFDVPIPEKRTRVDIDLPALRKMKRGTFGRAVADFFDTNGLDPKAIPKLEAMTDRPLSDHRTAR